MEPIETECRSAMAQAATKHWRRESRRNVHLGAAAAIMVFTSAALWQALHPSAVQMKAMCGLLSPTEQELYQAAELKVGNLLYKPISAEGVKAVAKELRGWAEAQLEPLRSAFLAGIDKQQAGALRYLANRQQITEKGQRLVELEACLPTPPKQRAP